MNLKEFTQSAKEIKRVLVFSEKLVIIEFEELTLGDICSELGINYSDKGVFYHTPRKWENIHNGGSDK